MKSGRSCLAEQRNRAYSVQGPSPVPDSKRFSWYPGLIIRRKHLKMIKIFLKKKLCYDGIKLIHVKLSHVLAYA